MAVSRLIPGLGQTRDSCLKRNFTFSYFFYAKTVQNVNMPGRCAALTPVCTRLNTARSQIDLHGDKIWLNQDGPIHARYR
ncbi:MAG: hypothetical protein AAF767_10495, partial [Pseudomonadota bacterium]